MLRKVGESPLFLFTMTLPFEITSRMEAIRSEAEQGGVELVDVQYRRAGNRSVLTFVVDKTGGVTLDDCAEVNRRLGHYLDSEATPAGTTGFLQGSYFLEVNSPGLDRPLRTPKDFERAKGGAIRVAWKTEAGAGLVALGRLLVVDAEGIDVEDKQGRTTRIPFDAVTKASRDAGI